TPIRIMQLDVADLLAYAQREGKDPGRRQTRLDFAGSLYDSGHTGDLWPPERNAPCWCGSNSKYKKCCGNPSFLAIEPPDPASLVLRIELDGGWRSRPTHPWTWSTRCSRTRWAGGTSTCTRSKPTNTPSTATSPTASVSYPSPTTLAAPSPTCTTSATTGPT